MYRLSVDINSTAHVCFEIVGRGKNKHHCQCMLETCGRSV